MKEANSAFKSPWVISWILLLLILVISTVYRVVIGLETFPGLVTADFYQRGQDYEVNMLKEQAQQAKWKLRVDGPRQVMINEVNTFNFTVKSTQGKFISSDQVTFYAYRPSDEKQDFSLPMKEVAIGTYSAKISFPLKGAWDVLFSIQIGESEINEAYFVAVMAQ